MIDLVQEDSEMDCQENDSNSLTDKPDPVPNPWPAEIKTSAKQNLQDNINLLKARWVGEKNNDIQIALTNLNETEDDGTTKKVVVDWLARRRDNVIVEEAWEKVAEVESNIDSINLPEDNHQQIVLQQ